MADTPERPGATSPTEKFINDIASSASGLGYITIVVDGGGLNRMLRRIFEKVNNMAGELDALRAEVANNTTVANSAVALLQGLKAALDAAIASGDMSQVQALSDQLGQNDTALAAAVAANTPTPPPTPTPTPAPGT